jgi:hypothetical protein
MLEQLQEKTAQIDQLRSQLQKQAEDFQVQLAQLRQAQFEALTQQRAPQLAAIEKSVVVSLADDNDADLRVAFGQLNLDQLAKLFGSDVTAQHIHHVDKFCPRPEVAAGQPRAPAQVWSQGKECARIEVHFKNVTDKRRVMLGATRIALEAKEHKMPGDRQCKKPNAQFKVAIKDHLLGVELKEKAQLQQAAMGHLLADQQTLHPTELERRIRFSWRRNRITWFVPAPNGNGGAWALLSHLLAHNRAAATAAAGPARRRAGGGTSGAEGSRRNTSTA